VSFPVSPRRARIGFHRSWSYRLSAGFKYRQPDGMYVPSSVDITIMMNATFRARPCTDIKRQGVENMPTLEAAFRRRVPLVDFDQVASVFDRREKMSPGGNAGYGDTQRFGDTS
jgi:hypothetical protein